MAIDFAKTSSDIPALSKSIAFDIAAAATASALISPIVYVIDGTIIRKAASSQPFFSCLGSFLKPILRRPHSLLTSVAARLVFSVYFGTYTTANVFDTFSAWQKSQHPTAGAGGTAKFVGTTAVSTGLTIYKDSRLAKLFGGQPASIRVPPLTYTLFTIRDAITIFASFNLPKIVAPKLTALPQPVKAAFGRSIQTESARLKVAQFLMPAAIQFITTPTHLLGLDFYNRQQKLGVKARLARVARDFPMATPTRMVRILPAFGLGGVVNTSTRNSLHAAW